MIKNFLKNHHMHQRIVPHLDIFFIYNPILFFTIWVMISMGMYIAHQDVLINPQWIASPFNFKIILLFVAITFLFGATFIKEQLIFIDSDSKKDKKTPLDKSINKQRANSMLKFSVIIGISILLFTNIYNMILGTLAYLALDFYFTNRYNFFKNYYFNYTFIFLMLLLLIFNGYAIVLSDSAYFFSLSNDLSFEIFLTFIFYALMGLSIFIMMEISESGNNNIMFRLCASLILIIVFIFSIYFSDPLLSISSICCLPFLLYALFRNLNKDLVRSIRYPVFICNFFIFTIYPYISIPLILIFYIGKYYYWHRFDIHFPTFLVEND